jgi:hypothetical protein
MASIIRIVQGDTKPDITLTLTDQITGDPLDLSAATTIVDVKFRPTGSEDVPSIIHCTKVDAPNGVVRFDFSGGVLDIEPGTYEAEIEVSFNGATHTVYDVLKFRVRAEF